MKCQTSTRMGGCWSRSVTRCGRRASVTISAAADVRKLSQRFELLASDPSSAWTLANELEVKSVTSAVTEWQFAGT